MEFLFFAFSVAVAFYVWKKNQKKGWYTLYSNGVPKRPAPAGDGGFHIVIPEAPGHINYIPLYRPPFQLALGQTVTVNFTIAGNDIRVFDYEADPNPTLGLIIGRKGDLPREGKYLQYRWFSNAAQEMKPGTYTMSVRITSDEWGPVQGEKDPAMFAAAVEELDYIGFVMGSAGGRGHGLYAVGPASFTLNSLVVN